MSSQPPLSPAEQAAAEALDAAEFDSELTLINQGSREEVARAVVAAVKPLIAQELAESAEVIYQFAESRPITSSEARAIFDGIAAALSRPTSEETQ